ncbi:MAG: hypothetical protein JO257_23255 [Deltaproteobacteria bacterium]|nr:hypothetical protein [Deltaproteobacteria bacterium]
MHFPPLVKLLALFLLHHQPPAKPTKPRTLANGRPACGNVMTKAPTPPECPT